MAAPKLRIEGTDPDRQNCMRCGSWCLDTGWECNDCGYDNMPHYCPPDDRQKPAALRDKGGG